MADMDFGYLLDKNLVSWEKGLLYTCCCVVHSNRHPTMSKIGCIKVSPVRFSAFLILIFFSLGCQPGAITHSSASGTPNALITTLNQREYVVHQYIALVNEGSGQPDKQNIWVALIRNFPPYQEVRSMQISPKDYTTVVDEYGNHYAEFDFSRQSPGTTKTVQIDYQVVVNELSYDLSVCKGDLPNEYVLPEMHIESDNPQIKALASRLSRGKSTVCQQVRAFYDYIGNELVYTYNGQNWGAQAALGPMGSDCTEYADLLVALSRAQGIPARYFEGLLYMDEGTGALAKTEHAWPDVYMPGVGWVALDPTLGRLPANHDDYFAHYTPNHIIVTMGVNPSVLRGSSYWTHLYWPGNSTKIKVSGEWEIDPIDEEGQ
jgi:transglutaminase-like putative cysteine protease